MPRRLLPALATAAMLAIASLAHAQPSATGFDRLFQQIDDGEVPVSAEAQSMEAIARLRAALPPGDERRARRFRSAVCALNFRHDIHGELAYAQRGIEDARRARDVDAEARFEFCRGYALETLRPNEALDAYGRALVLARRTEDARLIGDAYVLRGGIHSLLGDQAQALGDLLAAQAVFDRARLARRAEGNLLDIGTVYRRMGVYAQAMDYLRQSAAHARRTGSDPALFGSLMQQGYALEEQHQGPAAVRTFEEALAVAARTDRLDRGYAHLGLGNAWRVAGDARRALAHVAAARRDLGVDGNAAREPMLDQAEGLALAALGRHRAAIAAFDRAEPLIREQDNARYLAQLHEARARSREAAGARVAALADLRAYARLSARLREEADSQQVGLWRMRFDSGRQALENARLEHERRRHELELRSLEHERRWRWLALGLGLLVLATLAAFALQQRREARRLRVLALSDPLTGLANRRGIARVGADAFAAARRDGRPLSVVVLDLDHFKRLNDAHGHPAGDAVLARVTRACAGALRRADRLGRSGGEEFVALLPATGRTEALAIAERLRAAVAALDLSDIAPGLAVRVSAGVATVRDGDARLRDLFARADAALYRAKADGRDRVSAAD